MKILKEIYRVLRSVLFTAIILAVTLYIIAYVAISLPSVQNILKSIAEDEASKFLKTEVEIGNINITPFNQVILDDVVIPTPDGRKCIDAGRIGAGISLFDLLKNKRIIITYAELLDLHAVINQPEKDAPLNIQFIIDAFKPKESGKPPTIFDLKIRNVVIRRMALTFDKEWLPREKNSRKMDFNHLDFSNISLDVTLPRISNNDYQIDLRRLSLLEKSGFKLNKLTLKAQLTPTELSVSEFEINLPGTSIRPSDISLQFPDQKHIKDAVLNGSHHLILSNNKITPSDFSAFLPDLSHFTDPMLLSLDIAGNKNAFRITQLRVSTPNERLSLDIAGNVSIAKRIADSDVSFSKLRLNVTSAEMTRIINHLSTLPADVNNKLSALGELALNADARYINHKALFKGWIKTGVGNLDINAEADINNPQSINAKGRVLTDGINLTNVLPETHLGRLAFDISAEGSIRNKDIDGKGVANIKTIEYNGTSLSNIYIDGSKSGKNVKAELIVDDPIASINANCNAILGNPLQQITADVTVNHFYPSRISLMSGSKIESFSGAITADILMPTLDQITGELNASDLALFFTDGRSLTASQINAIATYDSETNHRNITLQSDYADLDLSGEFHITRLPGVLHSMVAQTLPSIIPLPSHLTSPEGENFQMTLTLHKDNPLGDFINLPVKMLTDIPLYASLDGDNGIAELTCDIPYLQQGRDKLIRNTSLKVNLIDSLKSALISFGMTMPNKNGDVLLSVNATAIDDVLGTEIGWKFDRKRVYDGLISLQSTLSKNPDNGQLEVNAKVNPSIFHVNDATWEVAPATVTYKDHLVDINNLHVSHGQQFVDISGKASSLPTDTVTINLSGIDLDYIFETLNINYVTFGGMATGKVKACSAFSKEPKAFTDGLWVQGLSYNGAVLGDAELTSHWDHPEMKVAIKADIDGGKGRSAIVDGGVWVTRDSLSFDLDANKVNIEFLQPFMAAFSSDVQGMASGKAKLYGTFSDIDLVGRLYADTIRMKLDYTNTYYAGSDSVFLDPGHISIPGFRLYDKNGHSALLSGWLKHRYFHEPTFEFKMRDARRLLCYDTDSRINPDWYGTIYGNGSASIKGEPGLVSILVDMTTTPGSNFTFVLNDMEAADDYRFLSFTDKRKEEMEMQKPDTVPDFVRAFRKRVEAQNDNPSDFSLDIRASITPQTQVNLIMDPVAGDRIKARGEGALQIGYSSENEDMTMYGKYVVEEGNYNFSLQDLILKDFTIRPGSSVTFNGDPLNAILDITAAYRVNTNLTELDPSFSSDRDLNRTNVPVEALLLVDGEINSPEIKFDISLPTVNSDVERKVRSIISTEDMMSRQVIYLLALNRFYAPDYTNSSSNGGGEFASVASSTLYSQITNMLGALTDKWTIAPSFRTDKGNFSDMEVDVTIASSFLNNRLLLNGNFGYRDRSTSNTTFVGDFDIEYLLNRSGNFRLKAYNHFNDQNYYLKSALTTQGVGIVLRRDFDDPLSWFKRLMRNFKNTKKESKK